MYVWHQNNKQKQKARHPAIVSNNLLGAVAPTIQSTCQTFFHARTASVATLLARTLDVHLENIVDQSL
jgi:hypothetical protein